MIFLLTVIKTGVKVMVQNIGQEGNPEQSIYPVPYSQNYSKKTYGCPGVFPKQPNCILSAISKYPYFNKTIFLMSVYESVSIL